jgi:hypothetical protein
MTISIKIPLQRGFNPPEVIYNWRCSVDARARKVGSSPPLGVIASDVRQSAEVLNEQQ